MPFELKVDVDEDCAICCDPLNHDLNFYPCACGFQLCSMCWHRIKNDESGNCPNCREPYKDEPYKFAPLTPEQEQKLKELRAREANQSAAVKPKSTPAVSNSAFSNIELNREKLSQVRVMQKNLVFVVGLSTRIAEENVLRRNEYFGKYGKILKVAVNQSTSYAGTQGYTFKPIIMGPSASAYVTYNSTDAALKCIQEVNGMYQEGRTLKATLGTTKYCSRFLNGQVCKLNDCMYLHEVAEEEASFTKEDMSKQKHSEYEKSLMDHFARRQAMEKVQKEKQHKEQKARQLAQQQANELRKKRQHSEEDKISKGSSPSTPPSAKTRARDAPTMAAAMVASAVPPATWPGKTEKNKKKNPTPSNITTVPSTKKPDPPAKSKKVEKSRIEHEYEVEDEEEQEEEEVQDAWDSSDEEITGNDVMQTNQSASKEFVAQPKSATPPITTQTHQVPKTQNTSQKKKKEIKKSETTRNQEKSQKNTDTSRDKNAKNKNNTQSNASNTIPNNTENKKKKNNTDNKVLTLLSSTEKPQLIRENIPNEKQTQGEGDRLTENDILFSANVTNDLSTRKHMTPSPPPLELTTRLTDNENMSSRSSIEPERKISLELSSGKPFDPFGDVSSGRSFSPIFTNGAPLASSESRPHSNTSGNSSGLGILQHRPESTGASAPPLASNSLLSQLEKKSPPPGMPNSALPQLPSGPPGLSTGAASLFNSARNPEPKSRIDTFNPFDFKGLQSSGPGSSIIQGLTNGLPEGPRVNGGNNQSNQSSQNPPFGSLPFTDISGLSRLGQSEQRNSLNRQFSQPPPGFMADRKSDLDWELGNGRSGPQPNLAGHPGPAGPPSGPFFSRQDSGPRGFDDNQHSQRPFMQPRRPDPFQQLNGFGLENGYGNNMRRNQLKDDSDLDFDPAQLALDQLGLHNKMDPISLSNNNRHNNSKQRLGSGSWNDQMVSNPFGSSNPFGFDRPQMSSHGPFSGGHGQPAGQMRSQRPIDLQASQDVFRRLMPNANLHFTGNTNHDLGANDLFGNKGGSNFAQGKGQPHSPQNHNRGFKPHENEKTKNKTINSVLLANQKARNPPPGFNFGQSEASAKAHLPSNLLDGFD